MGKIINQFGKWKIIFDYDSKGFPIHEEYFGVLNEVEMMLWVTDNQENRIGEGINLRKVISWEYIKIDMEENEESLW